MTTTGSATRSASERGRGGPLPISIVVLTFNEEENLPACLDSVLGWADAVYVVDGFSTDRTVEIARARGCTVLETDLRGYGPIYNWALGQIAFETDWIMRLDADEIATDGLREVLARELPHVGAEVAGLYVKRRIHFLGRFIRHGGCYPIWHLRIWRRGRGFCEERLADEHIVLTSGTAERLDGDIVDDSRKTLSWWVHKHNGYATREAIEQVRTEFGLGGGSQLEARLLGSQEQRKRWLNVKVYSHLPLFVRPTLYFLYRYVIKLGVLDGPEGLVWHVLQGFWYRFLVDAKIFEIRKAMRDRGLDARQAILEVCGQKV
ncbi:MAG: glycosyltransferase family 2 protein [Acidobacteriia bacterium]|nr:glycosyltransferase family 2 protein [Terriglobia bacterium]